MDVGHEASFKSRKFEKNSDFQSKTMMVLANKFIQGNENP